MIKNFALIRKLIVIPFLVMALVSGLATYYSGEHNEFASTFLIVVAFVLLPFAIGPVIFFAIHRFVYRDIQARYNLIVTSLYLFFFIIFIIAYFVEPNMAYFAKKRLLIFMSFGGLVILTTIYSLRVFIK